MRAFLIAAVAVVALTTPAFGQIRAKRGQGRPARLQAHPWHIAPEVSATLRMALNAVGNIRYSGTRVIEAKSGLNRVRHTEYVVTDGAQSRIEFPADSPNHGEVIVENATERRHYIPNRNEMEILPPQREAAFLRLAQMVAKGNAHVTEASGGAVAGINTQLVSIADKQGNVVQRLWIDPHSGMILKRELYDRGGALQGSFEFTQANLSPIVKQSDFDWHPKGVHIVTPDIRLDQIIRRQGFQNVRFPAGTIYKLEAARMQKVAGQQVLVQQYAAGGHRLSLYQLKVAVDSSRLTKIAPAGVNVVTWQTSGFSFVLFGDVAETELRDMQRRLGG